MSTELENKDKKEVKAATVERMDDSGFAYRPDIDIAASDNEVVFTADLPGVEKGDVSVEVDENDNLIIKAKNSFREPENAMVRQYGIGDYYRVFQISKDYNKDKISAQLENGVLEITLPRREEAKPRRIEVKA